MCAHITIVENKEILSDQEVALTSTRVPGYVITVRGTRTMYGVRDYLDRDPVANFYYIPYSGKVHRTLFHTHTCICDLSTTYNILHTTYVIRI